MRAAGLALSPKLMAVAVSGERGFAAILEERQLRWKLIEAKRISKVEEGTKSETDLTLPPPPLDRRFRRRV